jgi:hypothetical protein
VLPDSVIPMMRISLAASGMNRGGGLRPQSYQSSQRSPLHRGNARAARIVRPVARPVTMNPGLPDPPSQAFHG